MVDVSTAAEPVAPTGEPIPGPPGLGPKELRALLADAPRFFTGLREQYGPIASFPYGLSRGYLVSDPNVIQDIYVSTGRKFDKNVLPGGRGKRIAPFSVGLGDGLATSGGELHRKQRRLIQPVFHRQRIAGYGDAFAQLAEAGAAELKDGHELNIQEAMYELSLGMVAKTVFDVSLDSHVATTIRLAFPRRGGPMRWEQVVPFGRFIMRLPLRANRRFWKGHKYLNGIIQQMIDERRAGPGDGDDLLSVLINVRDADTGEPMNDQLLHDEAVTLLMAGHETSSAGLTWAYHLLAKNPEAKARLHAELDEVLGDRLPEAADLPNLPYTDAIFSEVMRMYPPVWNTVRRSLEDYDANGYVIPKDRFVMMSPWVVHHDPTWWPEPDRFAPQRWIAADDGDPLSGQALEPGRPRMAYLPFGSGPRQCIGNAFARMEAVMTLATIGRHWEFDAVNDDPVPILTHITVQPKDGLTMIARRRR
ncbi:cytochrome P450 [Streptacidiphilus sp. EB103A]|uniref:cytochrome P450 n=1 Tax=Streptacidiphilus sp. EB103A TaxID=3156275 RepID=UPI00351731CE